MKYLLDTPTLLWVLIDDHRLSKKAKDRYLDEQNDIYLSLASIWEISIKSSLNELEIKSGMEKFVDQHVINNNIQLLQILPAHLYALEKLPMHHRDYFDRMIISQAIYENLPVITPDKNYDLYSIYRIW